MIYPISVLKHEFLQLENEIERILNIIGSNKPCLDNKIALNKLHKKQKDLVKAIDVLETLIQTDDLTSRPEDSIKEANREP